MGRIGKYEYDEEKRLGHGSEGDVYKGTDTEACTKALLVSFVHLRMALRSLSKLTCHPKSPGLATANRSSC